MITRRTLLTSAAGAAALLAAGPGRADQFPSRAIRIVHGSNAGAPQDVMLRVLAEEMAAVFGKAVNVEGRPGGTGQAAIAYMMNQPADGHTIFSDATGITSVLQLPGAAFKWDDLQPVYRMQLDPFALYVKAGGKYKSLADVIADAKARPGSVRIGGYGTGSPHQISTRLLAGQAGVRVTWVPFDSGTKAIAAVMGDNLDAAMSNISVYKSFKGKADVVGTTAEKTIPQFPEVPTFKAQGFDLVRYHWRGMFVRKETPAAVLAALHDGVAKAVKGPKYVEYLTNSATLDGTMAIPAFAALLQQQAKDDLDLLKELGMVK